MSYKTYWENYYKSHATPQRESRFAAFVCEKILRGAVLLELGCGDGRDALFFAKNGMHVCAIDQASSEIAYLNAHHQNANLRFVAGDFTALEGFGFAQSSFDCVYSRFTLHSIDAEAQARVFRAALALLKDGGIFAIETRGTKNALYGKGEPVSGQKDAFIHDNHYRRFVHFERVVAELSATTMSGGGGDLAVSLQPKTQASPRLATQTISLSESFAKKSTVSLNARQTLHKIPLDCIARMPQMCAMTKEYHTKLLFQSTLKRIPKRFSKTTSSFQRKIA